MPRQAEIPRAVRTAIHERDQRRCLRCGGPATDLHHRRRRREGGHGLDNIVSLCRADHAWIHKHPSQARDLGYIVSAHFARPDLAPLYTFFGWVYLTTDGDYNHNIKEET